MFCDSVIKNKILKYGISSRKVSKYILKPQQGGVKIGNCSIKIISSH